MEKHLDIFAKQYMVEWDLKKFKRSHPRLFKAIIHAADIYAEEMIQNNEFGKIRH